MRGAEERGKWDEGSEEGVVVEDACVGLSGVNRGMDGDGEGWEGNELNT